jgi:DNA modification methylase
LADVTWEKRNRRSVWTVATKPFKEAHFATFPPDLIEPCILAGSRPGDLVLDPFGGAGTTAFVARRHERPSIYIDLNPEYMQIAKTRLAEHQ